MPINVLSLRVEQLHLCIVNQSPQQKQRPTNAKSDCQALSSFIGIMGR
jgi:hypothetical protein